MEVDFDKEIDALLRKARADGPVLVGDGRHMDADEIAAFAENAVPERSRGAYTLHLADCDRCRKILSNLALMNAVAAPSTELPGAITIAEREMPWYRKLFLFPNLAYVMGGLVLIFGGFLAVTVIRQSGLSGAQVASVPTESRADGVARVEPAAPSAEANANAAANVASNSMIAVNEDTSAGIPLKGEAGPRSSDHDAAGDAYAPSTESVVAPPPPPPAAAAASEAQPAPKDVRERDDAALAKEKTEDRVAVTTTPGYDYGKNDANVLKGQAQNMPGAGGPMRNESQYQRQMESLERKRAAPKTASRDEESSGRRAVGGRTFERKQGVWYDVAYQGRPTINVRRGTAEFERLDGGLRSIANSLTGTVVVVWGAKAYRIQ